MRSFLLSNQKLISKPYNLYYEIFKDTFEKEKKQQYVILSKDCDESITHLEINQNRIIDEIENNNNNLQIKDIEYLQLNSYKKSLIRLLLIKIEM